LSERNLPKRSASNCAERYVQDVEREDLLAIIHALYELHSAAHGIQPGGDCFRRDIDFRTEVIRDTEKTSLRVRAQEQRRS
jgi:hypothetical protein